MQTAQNILSFDASIKGGVKKQSAQKQKDSSENGEFLSMVLDAAGKGKKLDEKDLKEITNAVNMSVQKKEALVNAKIETINAKDVLGEEVAGNLFENATFMQLLQILEMLNGGEKISKYPNFSAQLAKVLSSETTLNELRGAKSLSELIEIANKLNLGLEKITVSQEQVGELNMKFPSLAKKNFFTPINQTQNIVLNSEIKSKIEEAININKKDEPQVVLNKLLQEVSKPAIQQAQTQQVAQAINQVKTEVGNNEKLPQQTTLIITKDDVDQVNDIVKAIEPKEIKKINLQSLLYPEREQSEQIQSEMPISGEKSDDSELNSMIRDIISNAKGQTKNLQIVRETFNNFNHTLKEQIEAYKSPFMRFNITLNPLNLGEVEITMVNRGNNLHINFNSNTQTMNLFLQNQAEFKASLVNMGFTELEMNFNDQNQKKEQAQKTYKNENRFGDNEDQDINDFYRPSIELILPRYI